jgi:ribosome biogenesis GTPase
LATDNEINLEELGWDGWFSEQYESVKAPGLVPGKAVSIEKEICHVLTPSGELAAQMSGRMRYEAGSGEDFPAVGDWLAVQPLKGEAKAVIKAILPRKSKFSRQISGGRQRLDGGPTEEQVVAANVDTVFLVSGLDGGRNLNLRRIERYLAIARASGAAPVIVLNKADLCPDIDAHIEDVQTVAYDIPVHAVSAVTGAGLDVLKLYTGKGSTIAFIGSSGVGKSALINALLGEERLATGEVRENDRRGRHTTTRRELFLLPGGGAVIDTPGMREIQVWGDETSLDNAFGDIATLAMDCRFADCKHDKEPGCAVQAAISRGDLDERHFQSYLKLQREIQRHNARQEGKSALLEKARWKKIAKYRKQLKKDGF